MLLNHSVRDERSLSQPKPQRLLCFFVVWSFPEWILVTKLLGAFHLLLVYFIAWLNLSQLNFSCLVQHSLKNALTWWTMIQKLEFGVVFRILMFFKTSEILNTDEWSFPLQVDRAGFPPSMMFSFRSWVWFLVICTTMSCCEAAPTSNSRKSSPGKLLIE